METMSPAALRGGTIPCLVRTLEGRLAYGEVMLTLHVLQSSWLFLRPPSIRYKHCKTSPRAHSTSRPG